MNEGSAHPPAGNAAKNITVDVALAGGGLANGLIAWRLAQTRPDLSIAIVEQGTALGGNHTWSFHETDISPDQHEWLSSFIVHRWDSQQVIFPERERHLSTGYRSITSERFDDTIRALPGVQLITGTSVEGVTGEAITLAGGGHVHAPLVLDGRGYEPTPHLTLAWQKFLGRHVRLAEPHGLKAPVIMDASVPQTEGYRFIYLLPFTEIELLIEDTYYADDGALDTAALGTRIDDYAASRQWRIEEVIREEEGILPITLGGDTEAFWHGVAFPVTGLRAGLFHPVTGYSLPDAVRLADIIAAHDSLRSDSVLALIRDHARAAWRDQRFYRLLNRMLFWAARPSERYKVLQRFYALPEALIGRFYAGQNTSADKLRILAGKPPVPVGRALPCLAGRHPDGISRTGEETR